MISSTVLIEEREEVAGHDMRVTVKRRLGHLQKGNSFCMKALMVGIHKYRS